MGHTQRLWECFKLLHASSKRMVQGNANMAYLHDGGSQVQRRAQQVAAAAARLPGLHLGVGHPAAGGNDAARLSGSATASSGTAGTDQ